MWNHHISTKHSKAELKDFTIIERERATPYTIKQKKHFTFVSKIHQWTETLASKIHHSTETWQSQNSFSIQQTSQTLHTTRTATYVHAPTQEGHLLQLVLQHKRQLTLYTFLISIYNKSVMPMFTSFKLQENWIFRSPPSKCHLLQKYLSFKFSGLLISSSNKAEKGTS